MPLQRPWRYVAMRTWSCTALMRACVEPQIANRIKAKGLQKLRWYCQLCQKQCRDENGFKCHQMSESHRCVASHALGHPRLQA
jgi:hypothetical protein